VYLEGCVPPPINFIDRIEKTTFSESGQGSMALPVENYNKNTKRACSTFLNQMTSLKKCLKDSEWLADAWEVARDTTEKETEISYEKLPEQCPWTIEDILSDNWVPQLFENR
jgi:hypothetical protein